MPPEPERAPRYPLQHVQELVRAAKLFIPRTSTQRAAKWTGLSEPEVWRHVCDLVLGLTGDEFVESRTMEDWKGKDPAPIMDVYAPIDKESRAWYLKFHVTQQVFVVSCHEPAWPLTRVDGQTVR